MGKTLKKLYNELGVPLAQRSALPQLAAGSQVAWLWGAGLCPGPCAHGRHPDPAGGTAGKNIVRRDGMSQQDDILKVLLSEEQLKAKCAEMGGMAKKHSCT